MPCRTSVFVGLSLVLLTLAGCQPDLSTPSAALSSPARRTVAFKDGHKPLTLDEMFLAIDSLSPGFGGIYWGGDHVLHIVHMDTTARAVTLFAIAQIMGADVPALRARDIRMVPGRFSFSSLVAYRAAIERGADVSWLITGDADEVNNRASFGVADQSAIKAIASLSSRLGIPDGAVYAFVQSPLKQTSGYLTDRQSTVTGALRIGFTYSAYCSVGFNFTFWDSIDYMVTASHCTPGIGSVDTSYHASQPYLFTNEAQEYLDPGFTITGGLCPSSHHCRYSDAAAFTWQTSQAIGQGLIAAPSADYYGWSAGAIDYYTDFHIVGEAPDSWLLAAAAPGYSAPISKIGQTSGFTSGDINSACLTFYSFGGSGNDLICQFRGDYYSYNGDSGGPVIHSWSEGNPSSYTSTAYLAGLTHHVDDVDHWSYFSSITGIQLDFGPMRTYPTKAHP